MIHVAYKLWGGDGFYAKMLGTSMLSMFENTKEKVTVHIMHNERLTPDNRGKFCYIAGQYGQRVEFHNVEEIAGTSLRKFEAAHPVESGVNAWWYSFISPEVFPNLDKIIFLGADTVINLDIGELWAYDLNAVGGGYGFGAVPEIKPFPGFSLCRDNLVKDENYFNDDVLILHPKFFHENFDRLLEGCRFIYENKSRHVFLEQDVLNYLFSENYLKLPYRFNVYVYALRDSGKPHRIEKAIYHFAGAKPDLNTDDAFNRLYLEYFLKTPWATVDMFGNIDKAVVKAVEQTLNESGNILLHVTNLLTKRRRAFLVDKGFQEPAKQIFEVNADELFMDFPTEAENLIRELNANNGKILLFVLTGIYPQIRSFLTGQNFVEGTDFINGFLFLSERQGFKKNFDTRQIFREM